MYLSTKSAIVTAVLLLTVGGVAADSTIKDLYPNLATGALLYAQPAELGDGVLLRADGVEITLADIEKTIAEQPLQVRAMLQKELFYVLEQEAAAKLLVHAARKALDGQGRNLEAMSDDQLINAMFEDLTKAVEATEEEQQAFYRENPHFFHGAPFDRVQPQIAQYLSQQKKQQAVEDYIKTLGQQMTIEIADDWTQQQARDAADNPLGKARKSGAPTIALFYAASPCCPDTMRPVLAAVSERFGDKVNTVTVNPGTEAILTARYGIAGNPALIFFDADGNEHLRRQGAMSQDEVMAALAEIGVK